MSSSTGQAKRLFLQGLGPSVSYVRPIESCTGSIVSILTLPTHTQVNWSYLLVIHKAYYIGLRVDTRVATGVILSLL